MRRAAPHELPSRAFPVMTARITEAELERWLPIPFDEVTDPLAAAERSKGALVQLDAGMFVVVYYGLDSGQLTVELPETAVGSGAVLEAFLKEVPIPASQVLWRRADVVASP